MNYRDSQIEFASGLMSRIFGWMSIGLATTGIVAYTLGHSSAFFNCIKEQPFIIFGLLIIQLVIALGLSFGVTKFNYSTSVVLFLLYSFITGVTFSTLFWVYQEGSIALAFFIAAAMFASMALYGAVTKHDLTTMGSILGMALWGLLIAMIINIFLRSSAFEMVISFIGVLMFAGLTAYDVQKLRALSYNMYIDENTASKFSIMGAFILYLDFINLFLFLLRLLGKQKNSE